MVRTFSTIKKQVVGLIISLYPTVKIPVELLDVFLSDPRLRKIYPDAMRIVDLTPKDSWVKVLKRYASQHEKTGFDLENFCSTNFVNKEEPGTAHNADKTDVESYISRLWKVLIIEKIKPQKNTILPLPNPYTVAGGRFDAMYYWDSYFIMLGLAAGGHYEQIRNMVDNFAYMLLKFGRIPNANHQLFLSRSQPPLFAMMVRLLAKRDGRKVYVKYLPHMMLERRFWMKNQNKLGKDNLLESRVVRMPDGEVLNRYYDDRNSPRLENYLGDVETARTASRPASVVYRNLRAAAESGWDFSSRWMDDADDLSSIRTTEIVPVDLNAYLYILEDTIAKAYSLLKIKRLASRFHNLANHRAEAINKYLWSKEGGYYCDFDMTTGKPTGKLTAACVSPLWAKIASEQQAKSVAEVVEEKLLAEGGLLTTTHRSVQQWDSPNGWAPLQWMAIIGLRQYGLNDLAQCIKVRWIKTNLQCYQNSGKLVEKYNVVNPEKLAGGGEYELQEGFGWTNGVLLALLHDLDVG